MPLLALLPALAAPPTGVEDYVRLAREHHPALEAADAAHDARLEAIGAVRSFPDPRVSAGFFLQSVETRTGPQQVRVGVQQTIPWFAGPIQQRRAAADHAEAADHRRRAVALELETAVSQRYWDLWETRALRLLRQEHVVLLTGLADTVRGRVEVGTASLAELQQVELARARLADDVVALDAREQAQVARLQEAIATPLEALPTFGEPVLSAPDDAPVASHPTLAALEADRAAAEHLARAAASDRVPDLTVGLDWIGTGEARLEGVADTGKDAVVVGVGMNVPLGQAATSHELRSRQADAVALGAERRAQALELQSRRASEAAVVLDTARRVRVLDDTLLPAAQAAYDAVLGEVSVGEGSLARALFAQRELLELAVRRIGLLAEHARARARHTALVGGRP